MMTYSGGPYVELGEVAITLSNNAIGPLNIPYSRISDCLQTISEKTITSEFIPYEWWFDYDGKLYFKEKRGSNKSSIVHLVAGDQIGGSKKEQISKQSTQRIRITGSGESAEQDRNTSDWYENTDEEENINSFYEKVESEKTSTSKELADVWAQVLLAQNSPIRNEITIILENDFYTAEDYDLGDEVTVTDPATGLTGKYRVKTIEKWINGDGGETVSVTVSKRRTDIMDRLANLFKILERMKHSSTYLDSMFAEGSKQTKLDPNKMDDVWEQTSSNKWYTELPEEDPNDVNLEECDMSGTGVTIACDKDEFSLTCNPNSMGYTFITEPLLKFSRDPKFTCEFEIDTDEGDPWVNGDFAYIRIWQVDSTGGWCTAPWGDGGFGFRIERKAAGYELMAYLNDWSTDEDGNPTTIEIKISDINADEKYVIEARMEWKEKVIKFYFGKADAEETDPVWGFRLRAIAPISIMGQNIDDLAPFHVTIDSRHAPSTQTLVLVFYRWRTQAIRTVE